MRSIEIIEEITSGSGNAIQVDDLATYKSSPVTADLGNNDIPSWGNVQEYVNESIPSNNTFRKTFTNTAGIITINWQTAVADGTNTWFELFGNFVEILVSYQGGSFGYIATWTYDGSGNVNVVSIDTQGQAGWYRVG